MAKTYINGLGCISAQKTFESSFAEEFECNVNDNVLPVKTPVYKDFIPPAAIRRMAKGVKNGIVAANLAMKEANVENLDAIITGTGMGCIEDSDKFLKALLDNNEEFLTPTSFIQSTHNTVGSQIALGIQCKAYNFTYVNAAVSFESALLDAKMQFEANEVAAILVGGVDEMSDYTSKLFQLAGIIKPESETPFDVLIVDDNSPDGTADKVKEIQQEFSSQLHLKVRMKKSGLGTAYVAGFKWAISQGYEYIFEMDADFSHNPNDLEKLLAACENGADVAIGSRYSNGVNVVNWPLSRVLLSYFASVYVRMITGMKIADATAGFKCYNRVVLERVQLDKIKFVGYAFQIEMKYRAFVNQFQIVEVPIIFTDRTKGQSKMSSGIIREAVVGVIMLRLRKIFNKL